MGKCVFVLLIHIERGLPNPLDEESSVNYIHLQTPCMGSTEAKRQISNLREQIRVFSQLGDREPLAAQPPADVI